MIGRWLVLHTLLFGIILASYWAGIFQILWSFDHVYAIPLIGGLIGLGSLLTALNRTEDTDWLADKLPAVGLLFTGTGVIMVAHPLLGQDLYSVSGQLITGSLGSMVGTVTGVFGYLWLGLVRRVC